MSAEGVAQGMHSGLSDPCQGVVLFDELSDTVKRTPSSRQKRAMIKIGYYTYEPKYTAAGVL